MNKKELKSEVISLLNTITERLVKQFAPERIVLFGSHVWGEPDMDSDLDVMVIVKNSDISPAKRASIAYRCLKDIPYPLDILIKTQTEFERFSNVKASLEANILQNGMILYG